MTTQLTKNKIPAVLALSDGRVFAGISIGAAGQTCGELVFNTAMSGYQEVITDPSYYQQIITFTAPHIGNVGINPDDAEARRIFIAGVVMREYTPCASNWRATQPLGEYLQTNNIIAIAGVDTRAITRHLRDHGAQSAAIITNCERPEQAIKLARSFKGIQGVNLTHEVSTNKQTDWHTASLKLNNFQPKKINPHKKRVIVYDFGCKQQIMRLLIDRNCEITVVPATTTATQIIQTQPDGILLSNGPGDPAACTAIIKNIQQLFLERIPLFGICLGAQLLALALGGTTFKMKFGHHGANHPVQDLATNKVFITSQNHGFAINEDSLAKEIIVTHRSLFDRTVQGFKHTQHPIMAFQGHPEGNPGPQDIEYLFDDFIQLLHKMNKTPCPKELT